MIFNASHSLTNSLLPADILDTYVQYKINTRAIMSWIASCAPKGTSYASYLQRNSPRKVTIREFEELAYVVSNHVSKVPEQVHFEFREAIRARRKLSAYFKKQREKHNSEIDDATVQHEHFTSSLSEIYSKLCEKCVNSMEFSVRPSKLCQHQPRTMKSSKRNSFEELSLYECSGSGDSYNEISISAPCVKDEAKPSMGQTDIDDVTMNQDFRLQDDELSDRFERLATFQLIYEAFDAVDRVWRLAGLKEIPLVLATAITNVHYAAIREYDARIRLDQDFDVSTLCHQFGILVRDAAPGCDGDQNRGKMNLALQEIQTAWEAVKATQTKCCPSLNPGQKCFHKPAEHVESPNFPFALGETFRHSVSSPTDFGRSVDVSTELPSQLANILHQPVPDNDSLCSSFALHLSVVSYRAYFSTLSNPAVEISLPRIQALKRAKEIACSLSTLLEDKQSFPCRCVETISYHLHNLQCSLAMYTKDQCWSLAAQAPWVTGCQILEMFDASFYYGVLLLTYRHYVGSIVHTYNALRQTRVLEKEISMLEGLIDRYGKLFFPSTNGERPRRRFASSWSRFLGARLKFTIKGSILDNNEKGPNFGGNVHRPGSMAGERNWCMAIPPHVAKRDAGLSVGKSAEKADGCSVSRILNLKRRSWHYQPIASSLVNSETLEREKQVSSYLSVDLSDSSVPLTRLNLFGVYSVCARAVSDLSFLNHTSRKDQEMRCICFVRTILEGADRNKDNQSHAKAKKRASSARMEDAEYQKVVQMVMDVLEDVFVQDTTEEDWLWAAD